jgi:hypothetical protein
VKRYREPELQDDLGQHAFRPEYGGQDADLNDLWAEGEDRPRSRNLGRVGIYALIAAIGLVGAIGLAHQQTAQPSTSELASRIIDSARDEAKPVEPQAGRASDDLKAPEGQGGRLAPPDDVAQRQAAPDNASPQPTPQLVGVPGLTIVTDLQQPRRPGAYPGSPSQPSSEPPRRLTRTQSRPT